MYRLDVSAAADRDLQRLKERISGQDFERLRSEIRGLINEPRPQGVRKILGEERTYRVRVGNYRIIYEIYDDTDLITILQVARRNEATYRL